MTMDEHQPQAAPIADPEQVIHLTGEEEIHAIRTMLRYAEAPRVLFVVPKKHRAFSSLARLQMLLRQAHAEGVQMALVTSDNSIRDLADQMGLSSFRTVQAGQRARRWRDGYEDAPIVAPGPVGRNGAASLALSRDRTLLLDRRRYGRRGTSWAESLMFAGLLFAMMIVLSGVLVLLVPSARITLIPRQEPIELSLPVTIDPTVEGIDYDDLVIPGETVTTPVQGTMETATSGRRDVPTTPARGTILFANVTGQPVSIPAGTIVSTTSGTPIRFRTTESVSLPAELNARASAPIEAINPGPSGNVGPLQINFVEGSAAADVRVLNERETEGGGVEQRPVVTAADQEQLREQLRQRLIQQGRATLESSLAADQFLVPNSVTLEQTALTYTGNVDAQLEVLGLDFRGRVSGVVASREDVTRIAQRRLREAVPEGYRLLEEGSNVATEEAPPTEEGLSVVAVRANAVAGAELPPAEIRNLVRGQPLNRAQDALVQNLPLAADPAIEVTPDWWNRMPYLPLRIFIRVGVLERGQQP